MPEWLEPIIGNLVTIILALVGSGGVWTLIQKRSDRKSVEQKMLMGLAHDKIMYLSLQYINRGHIFKDEYENLHKYLYTPYKDLGGNGAVARLMKEVEKLEIKSFPISETEEVRND